MPTMNLIQAIRSGLEVMLQRDQSVCVFGEDVGYFGGVFRATDKLQQKYGPHRVFDTPLAEGGIVGVAIGMGLNGLRPVPEIQFSDYIFPAFDQITNELARLRYRSGGEWSSPVTIRAPWGGGIRGGMFHSQSPEAYFTHTPGLVVVVPSTPYDAKGLLISSIESDDPVIFFEPKRLYRGRFDGNVHEVHGWQGQPGADVPEEYYTVPLGSAAVVREGTEVTILSWGTMVHVTAAAIDASGADAELIDLRTLVPLDVETIVKSVEKTGRCLIVHEAPRTCGFGAELSALVQENCFWHLEAPVRRVTGWDTPIPHTHEFEYLPSPRRIAMALEELTLAHA
jgi:2-oxoisovalerate dehydrogenase E1 component beta subunit